MKNNVDIIMGIYNCEKYLADSIESILSQTYKNWRLIMCDDGSTDSTYEIAEKYAKKYKGKIILLKNKKNMGLNYTLNKCAEKSTAKYIARQDADDISLPTRLEKEVKAIEANPEYAVVSTDAILFDKNGDWGKFDLKEKPEKDDFTSSILFCHASAIIRKDVFDKVGGYSVDKKLLRVEDYNLWSKIYAAGYKGYNIKEPLYRVRDDKDANKRRTWQNRLNEYHARKIAYKIVNVTWYKRMTKFRPIVLGLMPMWLYNLLRRKRIKG
jgi:glycosyltransferase EpsE